MAKRLIAETVLCIYCADEDHDLCDGWFIMWPCSCPCRRRPARNDGQDA